MCHGRDGLSSSVTAFKINKVFVHEFIYKRDLGIGWQLKWNKLGCFQKEVFLINEREQSKSTCAQIHSHKKDVLGNILHAINCFHGAKVIKYSTPNACVLFAVHEGNGTLSPEQLSIRRIKQ